MPPRFGSVGDPGHVRPVPLRRPGRTSLERADERERYGKGDGEQQYE